jgi:PBSX family phage terminase large subunit
MGPPMIRYSVKQAEVIKSGNARWNILSGAVRSGKTYVGYDLIPRRLFQLPEGNRLLIGKTERTLKRNVIDPMQERFGRKYITDISNGECKIFGRRFYCVGANDERSVTKIQGIGLVYAYGDEITTWPQSFFEMLKSRLSAPGAIFDGTCNPEGPFHWLKVDMLDRGEEIGVKHWHFTIDDNPFLEDEFVRALKSEYTGVWYKRMILGLWVAAEGAIYDMLDERSHVVDTLPSITKYWVGMDYGTASVTCFWLLGLGSDNNLYFTDFWRWDAREKMRQKTDIELVTDLLGWLEGLGVECEYAFIPEDAASFITQLHHTLSERKRNGRHNPIRSVQAADRSPGSVVDGIRDVSSLFSARRLLFSKRVADNGGMKEWVSYVWDEKKALIGEDEPLKQNDHDCDSGRYTVVGVKHIWYKWLSRKAA